MTITARDGIRRFEPEEIEQVLAANEHGDLVRLARILRRPVRTLYDKRGDLHAARRARAAQPSVFLPDDGLPYAARVTLLLREHRP